ncbi:hypothetical protein K493DRAFT_365231 [Basidiobolus meristosporus CBS 931.73]|uniref:Phosphodiester glycosidase domain-containing protein n=1 Tax=Basidiobolus meristosporus CBS 931.73 TaxID=1314790 RepID=A0A1Y1VQU1_9FUNG|nr:hypothetical protein K493DRAFT_365231 [Basidiobolus meristosporus CBS 931.73]|eukprot:ORX63533.1 hypothetical protein K493DRAFT_365231 [Basidiobolus meristosporus CBS 931.73]
MSTNEARVNKFTFSGLQVTAIVTSIQAVDVANVGSTTVAKSNFCGSNGCYFNYANGNLVAIACSDGGKPVRVGGEKHANDYTRGTMICRKLPNGELTISVEAINKLSDSSIPLSEIRWAVGGLGLYLNSTMTNKEWLELIKDKEHAWSVGRVYPEGKAARTAIGYRRTDNKIILASIQSATPSQVRDLMKTYIGCELGVMLDGGASSQIKGKTPGGTIESADYENKGKDRGVHEDQNIYSMVTVSPTRWISNPQMRR